MNGDISFLDNDTMAAKGIYGSKDNCPEWLRDSTVWLTDEERAELNK